MCPPSIIFWHVGRTPRITADYHWRERMYVRLQNLPWSKTGLVSRQVLHPLSKLQNWILSKTGRYKTSLVSNTKIEASLRATKPKPSQSNLTSYTVEIFIQNKKAGLVPMQSRLRSRHKAGFGAAGLGTAQSWFWSRHSQFWSGIKTSLVSRQVLHPLSMLQNWISPKTGQYKTCIVSNTKIDCVYIYIYLTYIFFIYIRIYITKRHISRKYIYIYTFIYTQSIFSIGY